MVALPLACDDGELAPAEPDVDGATADCVAAGALEVLDPAL